MLVASLLLSRALETMLLTLLIVWEATSTPTERDLALKLLTSWPITTRNKEPLFMLLSKKLRCPIW